MSVAAPGRLPRRVLVAVRLSDERGTRTAEFVAHRRRWALALSPLSPHVRIELGPPGAPLTANATVQRLRPLVCGFVVFMLLETDKSCLFSFGRAEARPTRFLITGTS
jgi:hypothetical protein